MVLPRIIILKNYKLGLVKAKWHLTCSSDLQHLTWAATWVTCLWLGAFNNSSSRLSSRNQVVVKNLVALTLMSKEKLKKRKVPKDGTNGQNSVASHASSGGGQSVNGGKKSHISVLKRIYNSFKPGDPAPQPQQQPVPAKTQPTENDNSISLDFQAV